MLLIFKIWKIRNVGFVRNLLLSNIYKFLQRVCIARQICLSVCPSVTFRCFVQRNEDTIVRSSASGRTIILVSGEVKFIRIFAGRSPPTTVLKWSDPLSPAKIGPSTISRKRCKIVGMLVLITNRKSHYGLSIGTEIGYLKWPWTA